MKILQINNCHYRRGGSETVYFNTIKLLKDHGHDVSCFSSKDTRNEVSEYEKYFIPNENIRDLSVLHKILRSPAYLYNEKANRNLEQLIKDLKPDVAHIHLFYAVLSVSILRTLNKYKIPIVHTVHDYRLVCPVNTFLDKNCNLCELCLDKHFYHCLQKRCSEGRLTQSTVVMLEAYFWKYFVNPINYIDHFIFVSKFIQQKHSGLCENLMKKCSQIYNYANTNSYDVSIVKGNYFLFFGRLSVEKGIKTLLSVFSRRKGYKLIIAGTGPLKDFVAKVAQESINIEYVGFKVDRELELLIRNASFIIIPSEWYENNPLSLIETYKLGKPVIGADVGGIPELVQHGTNGFLFESRNDLSLESVVDLASGMSYDDYTSFSRSAYDFALKNFDKERHYEQLLKVYQDVINEKMSTTLTEKLVN
jgi:glycosyltransferase involved in cell wall biosynthesis